MSATIDTGSAANLAFTNGSQPLGTKAASDGDVLTYDSATGTWRGEASAGGTSSARTTSGGTDTIVSGDVGGTVVYGANCTVTITSGLTTGSKVVIGSSAAVTLTWSVSGGESISEASTALNSSASVWIVKVSSTAWRVLQGAVTEGWILKRSLSFNGITPAVSMSVPDSVTGNSYTATLTTATGWSAVSGGIEYDPATAGCDVDIDLDTLLGSTWQQAGVLICWDILVTTLTGSSVVVLALADGTDVYTLVDPAAWTNYVGASGGATGALTATSQRVLAMIPTPTGGTFFRSQTASAEYSALTKLGYAAFAYNSATWPITGLTTRIGLNEPGGSALKVRIDKVRVYARYGL